MQLSKEFSRHHNPQRISESVLKLEYSSMYYYYDFDQRLLSVMSSGQSYNATVTPFSQLDREMLVAMRDKLVELGGTPPELPAETSTGPAQKRGLNP